MNRLTEAAAFGPRLAERAAHEAINGLILARAGVIRPVRPDRLVRMTLAAWRWGASPATLLKAAAARHPSRAALLDERGALSYAALDHRSDALAVGLSSAGLGEGDRVGLMCRDHRGFVEGLMAVAKLGADTLLLNTGFAGPQLQDVCDLEGVAALILDAEFIPLLGRAAERRPVFRAWSEPAGEADGADALIETFAGQQPRPPGRPGRVTILTSGTTGAPKGAQREVRPRSLDPAASLLERIPMRDGDTIRIAAPLFHSWGLGGMIAGLALGARMILRRRFDAEECLRDLSDHRCQVLWVVPVMLARILAVPEEVSRSLSLDRLRAVCASGSSLSGDLAARWMDRFGENLYNLYGSTEVAAATLATPADLRAAPGTAGRPARGSTVRILDDTGAPVASGSSGRIFVANATLFEGYTGGGQKQTVKGMMATGDVGRFDASGRLFVEGRDDEMIVSGGENVFPQEVEDLLATHPAVAEAAVIGVTDPEFGQRLRAFVVPHPGHVVDEAELNQYVASRLARFKIPREVVFLEALPRNATGKVLKRELAARGLKPASGSADETESVDPGER